MDPKRICFEITESAVIANMQIARQLVDGSLVREVATTRVSQATVHAVNYVAHVVGMKSIAEFVESQDIMAALRKLSVDYAQGYAIGKPEPFID